MKKFAIIFALFSFCVVNAEGATANNPRGSGSSGDTSAPSSSTRSVSSSARSATINTRSSAVTPSSSTRSATSGRTTVSRNTTTPSNTNTSRSGVVTARAGSTQKVLNSGTTVASANENVIVSEACRQKYYGCMDSFCMLDNDSGGRCICSDKNAEYDDILAQIEQLDQQSYQMATYGVERIEMGDAADAAIANANAVALSIIDANNEEEERTLDLTSWLSPVDFTVDDIFADTGVTQNPIEGKEGDALYQASHQICIEQMPECESELSMLQLMYAQQIRSDCTAYENSLKQQKNASAQKLYVAEQALREAALEQYQTANAYDLGQCTVAFKDCMISTGGCGEDFSGCASIAAFDSTSTRGNKNASTYEIQGNVTSIEIQASTYDILLSKKPLCDTVTKQCQAVADQVWDTFLKEVAPQVKSAELIAEDNARQNCIGNISSCFQQACKDTMDPKDPEGSYDLCLTRPESMLNLCQVPLNACGVDTSSSSKAQDSEIWDFVVARLASMRVNSCTTQIKECLQSEDRCGSDYTQCIGLDTDTIIRMCPEELLVGCQNYSTGNSISKTGNAEEDFYAQLEPWVQGIILNIDNNLLEECRNIADEAMITVCGDTENCDNMTIDSYIGSNTLEYKICNVINYSDSTGIDYNSCYTNISQITDEELGRDPLTSTQSSGENVTDSIKDAMYVNATNGSKFAIVIEGEIPWDAVSFNEETGKLIVDESKISDSAYLEDIKSELGVLQNSIDNAISAIESNPQVQFCMTGRDIDGIGGRNIVSRNESSARFPSLTKQMRALIASSSIKKAMDNYYNKYAELEEQRMQDYVNLGERVAEIQEQNLLDARRESARLACTGLSNASALATSAGRKNVNTEPTESDLVGSKTVNNWNYKETVTSTFNWEDLVCHRCTRTQNCLDPKGGRRFCKEWADAVETCTDIQF